MNDVLPKIKNSISLIVSLIALGGLLVNFISKKVGEQKDIEYLQKDFIEMELEVDAMEKTQIEADKERAIMQEFIEGHLRLHEELH